MLAIDLKKLENANLNVNLIDVADEDAATTNLPSLLAQMQLGSTAEETRNKFLKPNTSAALNMIRELQALKSERAIADVIGSSRTQLGDALVFSTFICGRPKAYVRHYLSLMSFLRASHHEMRCVIWLEDLMTSILYENSRPKLKEMVEEYRLLIRAELGDAEILVSSALGLSGVPQEFVDTHLSSFTCRDLFELLPYHQRSLALAKVADVIHFVWNCYAVHLLPGIHLVGSNTKRHMQMVRKALKGRPTIVLVRTLPE